MKHELRLLRNEIVSKLLGGSLSQSSIGEVVGLSQQMVSSISFWVAAEEVLSMPSPGRKSRLSAEQLSDLPKLLSQGSVSYDFTGEYWTHNRVKYVIEKAYGVVYEEKQVGRILKKIGWSLQKPQKTEAKQDAVKVSLWKETSLPALKKKAIEEDYAIYYHDESTVQLCANVVKTYAPIGKTPTLPLHDTKGYQYVCVASSISPEGQMYYQIRNKGFKGEQIVAYLKALLQTTHRKIMLIWDNASWHKAAEVKEFLKTKEAERLWLANTPAYSPELNPSELIWANLKFVQIPNTYAKNITQLTEIVKKGMTFIAQKAELVASFFNLKNYYFTDS